ncbi:MAG: glutamine synthetase III [Clostridiales bacterium]|nr:glutamine synthetase III [Clostridiales bacterium]
MNRISEIFGKKVFNDKVMKEKLPKDAYNALRKHIEDGTELEGATANVIASAMKDWALENGATHFTHWFQPMTGVTAEKHDSFMTPDENGGVIMNFSGKELIKGEPDASSFPSGGIRATFEARGYTAWDPSSYVFIKGNTLCIPTAFCSYGGEALDKKTPLLLSMEAINRQALRLLDIIGSPASKVITTVGPEQEYFLIPESLYRQRKDLVFCGRTLLGAKPPKSQELDDHYFGAIKPKISEYMEDLNNELWQLGVLANTEHNEVAPSQHELAPIFSTANIASDHNQLTMEMMKKVAERHGLVCLLHEKPFAGINGSGKHINWSMATDDGTNLLKPGKDPISNTQFLLFLSAVIKAVDEYQDLLRISVSGASNDHRLGGNEAPPSIISIFLGDDLLEVMEAVAESKSSLPRKARMMDTKASVLPDIKKDTTDRNRTSPFAFTGSRFEFRMAGSLTSVSCPAYMLNTIVAEALRQFADELESAHDVEASARELIKKTYIRHKRIIFNGNNYSEEWVREAESRGLLNLRTTVDALPYFTAQKNLDLFQTHKIFTKTEVEARQAIFYEEYCKIINIEALTLLDIINRDVIPAVSSYISSLAETVNIKKSALGSDIACKAEINLATLLSSVCDALYTKSHELENALAESDDAQMNEESARYFCDVIIPLMTEIRTLADELEVNTSSEFWPMPTYGDLLFA